MWCYGESRCMHGKESHNCWESRSPFVCNKHTFRFRRASLHKFPSINFGNSSVSVSGGGRKGNALTEGCLLFSRSDTPAALLPKSAFKRDSDRRAIASLQYLSSLYGLSLPFPECTLYIVRKHSHLAKAFGPPDGNLPGFVLYAQNSFLLRGICTV